MGIPGRVPHRLGGTLPGILAIDLPTRRVGRSIAPTDLFWGRPQKRSVGRDRLPGPEGE